MVLFVKYSVVHHLQMNFFKPLCKLKIYSIKFVLLLLLLLLLLFFFLFFLFVFFFVYFFFFFFVCVCVFFLFCFFCDYLIVFICLLI